MKTKLLFIAFVSSFIILHSALGQGVLTPPGAPAPTMKTLDQIDAKLEKRTPISSAPFTISVAGSYYLTTNVTVSAGDAITIAADNVTLDLNGFTISSTRATATTDSAILLSGSRTDITIANGHISSGVTNTAAGVFGGGGFGLGIYYSGNQPSNVRVKAVSVAGVLYYGIYFGLGSSTVVEGCTVNVAGTYGIYADSVADSTALNCGGYGIVADTALNCKGSGAGYGSGLDANTANNCYGYSSGSGYGLFAITANNCCGYSSSSLALYAYTANNCYGSSSSGTGLNAVYVATGCSGYSYSGTGLNAFIANVCHGVTSSGTALSTTHNVNSF